MRNVVLVCLDSVRKDAFDEFAPRLRGRASLSFSRARAASSWTVPSHASLLTGQLPHEHGVHTYNRDYATVARSSTFLDALPEHRALGASANVFASGAFGFDAFFDEFASVSNVCVFPDGLDVGDFVGDSRYDRPLVAFLREAVRHPRPLRSLANGAVAAADHLATGRPVPNVDDDGAGAVARAARSLVADAEEPFFLFANLMEAHVPLVPYLGFDGRLYDVPRSYTTATLGVWDLMDAVEEHDAYVDHWRQLYGAAVDFLDRRVARLVDWLSKRTDRETTVVVTADHGENLGYPWERGFVRHKSSLSEGLLAVPLVVVDPPDGEEPPVDRYVSHLDLGAFLVDLARGDLGDPTSERVPAEVLGMSAGPEPPARREYWDRAIRCVYDGDAKACWNSLGGRVEYELDPDRPNWQRVAAEDGVVPGWADDHFSADIDAADREARRAGAGREVSEATGARLEALGYR